MTEQPKYHGHMTLADGSHVPLSQAEAQALWDESDRRQKERAEKLPDERAAIDAMFEAWARLKELGWRDPMYCPKDGSPFNVIEAGSTGIFRGHYSGKWPSGSWWAEDGGDLWPSHPILFRLLPEDEAKYQAKRKVLKEKFAEENKDMMP